MSGGPVRKVLNEDLYQLFFYQQRLQRKYNLSDPPPAFIACPLPEDDERAGSQVLKERFQRIVWQAGSERSGDVKLLFIPLTKFLRCLMDGRSEQEASRDIEGFEGFYETLSSAA